jgi:hypothetical protein
MRCAKSGATRSERRYSSCALMVLLIVSSKLVFILFAMLNSLLILRKYYLTQLRTRIYIGMIYERGKYQSSLMLLLFKKIGLLHLL